MVVNVEKLNNARVAYKALYQFKQEVTLAKSSAFVSEKVLKEKELENKVEKTELPKDENTKNENKQKKESKKIKITSLCK